MEQVYLQMLKSRYKKSLENKEEAVSKKEPEIITPLKKDNKEDEITELHNKLNKLIELKEMNSADKNKRKQSIVNKKTNGDPAERARKMREAKENKKKEELEKIVKEIEGKDPQQVKKELNAERKKITLLKKIISDV